MAEENPLKPFYSVLILAFFCSALVAGAAVGLRPLQEANRTLDQKKNILYAAGLYVEGSSVEKLFASIETRIVDLETGSFVPETTINPESFNQKKAILDPDMSSKLGKEVDTALLGKRENYSKIYLVKKGDTLDQLILPVRGKGLWSTMYAYVAIRSDLSTITGISFYEHGETPGLGGEIENRSWQEGWQGKQIYNNQQEYQLAVVKGKAATTGDEASYQIDGLSGATLTATGVNNLMEFWFGDHGFKPFFDKIQQEGLDG